MLGSLRSKYRSLFLSSDEYHERGLILSDDILSNLEVSLEDSRQSRENYKDCFLPMPAIIPDYSIGDKIGEGLTSETFAFLEKLTPFPLVVQFNPITLEETQHLAYISSLLTQLYALCPHLILYLGYYLAPATEDSSERRLSYDTSSRDSYVFDETLDYSSTSSDTLLELDYDSYAFLYEQVPATLDQIYSSFKADLTFVKSALAQLFFTLELLRRCGFNHGDINPGNISWTKQPTWQGRNLLNYKYYAYLIGTSTYYLPAGPILRLLDFNLTSYDDGTLRLSPSDECQDDFESALLLAQDLLPNEEYQELVDALSKDENGLGWISLFSEILPQPGDKIILLGRLPELSSE